MDVRFSIGFIFILKLLVNKAKLKKNTKKNSPSTVFCSGCLILLAGPCPNQPNGDFAALLLEGDWQSKVAEGDSAEPRHVALSL